MTTKKKLFMIAVVDEDKSHNRAYTECIKFLLNSYSDFKTDYQIELHNDAAENDLYESLHHAIQLDYYEGYIVLLDCVDDSKGLVNPNVMFEFGGIKSLKKPFIVIASHSNINQFPFDVKNLNVGIIPSEIDEYISSCYQDINSDKIRKWYNGLSEDVRSIILDFFSGEYNNYIKNLKERKDEIDKETKNRDLLSELINSHYELKKEIKELTRYVSNTTEYIDGEAAAFSALSEAVSKANESLRTTRFANQSIVKEPTKEQKCFMDHLYDASKRLKGNSIRIICNNNPAKWQDIYNFLFQGGNGSRIYVRKADFSIHFEIVVIDESVAFIHFYQQVHANVSGRGEDNRLIEKLNSTLKIQGSGICQKFAEIYDRLHHRDVENGCFSDPSRTLLGVNMDNYVETSEPLGYFELDSDRPLSYTEAHFKIMQLFKHAFENWDLGSKDKINMVVGIAFLENRDDYIHEMHNSNHLNDQDYQSALSTYQKLNPTHEDGSESARI